MKIIYKSHGFCRGEELQFLNISYVYIYIYNIHVSDMTNGVILECTVALNNALSIVVGCVVVPPLCLITRGLIDGGPIADIQLLGYVLKRLYCYIQFRNP